MRKCVLCHMRTTKAQISAFVVRCLGSIMSRFYSRNFKTLASFCSWACQFESHLVGNSRRHVFSWRGSFVPAICSKVAQHKQVVKCFLKSSLFKAMVIWFSVAVHEMDEYIINATWVGIWENIILTTKWTALSTLGHLYKIVCLQLPTQVFKEWVGRSGIIFLGVGQLLDCIKLPLLR